MQLGTRWAVGDEPPSSVPEVLHETIREVERDLPADAPRPHWTLTWLEGRPIAELDAGVEVTLDAAGSPVARPFDD